MRPDPLRDQEYFARTDHPQPKRGRLRGLLPLAILIGWLIFMAVHMIKAR